MRPVSPLLERVRQLVAEPSVSSVDARFDSSNRAVIDRIADWADSAGFSVAIEPLPEQPNKWNLIATIGRGEGGVVLAGHTDTVPWDDAKWASDPFRVREEDGKLFGLGVADMKSFFAVALEAVARLGASSIQKPIMLVATADEESTMQGARALAEARRLSGAFAIVGEPTGLSPKRMHKGALMFGMTITGRSGHSSDPRLGNNAIDGAMRVIAALDAYRKRLVGRYSHASFAVPYPTMNFGAIHGGDSPNRICGECELRFDMRVVPGMDVDEAEREVRDEVAGALDGTGLSFELALLHEAVPPFETPANARLVTLAAELTGAEAGSVAFGTEAPYFASLGHETIVLGPGDIDVAHQPNEFVRVRALHDAIDVYARMLARLQA